MEAKIVTNLNEPFTIVAKFDSLAKGLLSLPEHMDISQATAIAATVRTAIAENKLPPNVLTNHPWILGKTILSKNLVFTYIDDGFSLVETVNN